MTEDEIRLSLPAVPEFARLARLTVAGLASRIGFSYDEVEDLRIAVGEAFSLLVEEPPNHGVIDLRFVVEQTTLDITVRSDAGPDPRSADGVGLSRQILEAVVDTFDLGADLIHLRKHRAPAAP